MVMVWMYCKNILKARFLIDRICKMLLIFNKFGVIYIQK